jgi:predicted RNase H-like HicB family nuclease
MRYQVNLNKTEKGYTIWCPALPGCWTMGDTEEEALKNIKDAIKTYIEKNHEGARTVEFYYIEVR